MPAAPTWSCSRWGFPCRRRCRRRGALLPHRFTLAARPACRSGPAVYFLWHFPWGRPRRALPGTVPPWSPDFPLPAQSRRAAIRPSGIEGFGYRPRPFQRPPFAQKAVRRTSDRVSVNVARVVRWSAYLARPRRMPLNAIPDASTSRSADRTQPAGFTPGTRSTAIGALRCVKYTYLNNYYMDKLKPILYPAPRPIQEIAMLILPTYHG
jgi:hypothetical protein